MRARCLPIAPPRRIVNGVAGAIGAGTPFAIAARAWETKAPIIAVMGDGRPFEYFQQVYLTGTLSEVLAKIDERIRVGVEYLMLHTLEPSPRQLDLWAEHVLPRLMDRGAPRDARPDVPG